MSDTITITGLVATTPRAITTAEGLAITSFRVASTQRRYDRVRGAWIDGDTNWYTITAFRQLATNAAASIRKGERVVVTGRLRIREWENGEKTGTTIEIEADSLGHDLTFGTSAFSRAISAAPIESPDAFPAADSGSGDSSDDEAGGEAGDDASVPVGAIATPF